jgi:hypothetical protein
VDEVFIEAVMAFIEAAIEDATTAPVSALALAF